MKWIGALMLGLALTVEPMAALAASPWVNEATYGEKALGKLRYGATNVLLGWTEMLHTPHEAGHHGESVVTGMGRGVVNAVGDTLGGVLHVITFPIPQFDVPLPDGGIDIVEY